MANYNKITYKGRTITDEDLAIGGGLTNNMMLYQALISEELKPDTFTFNLIYDKNKVLALIDADGKYLVDSQGRYLLVRADEFDPEDMTFGDSLNYYINNGGTLMGKWYVRTVRRVQKKVYRFECTSAIGLMAYYGHNGGVYSRASVGDVIASLMGSIPYSIQPDLAGVAVTGWLPKVSAARDNLQAVLFMAGACVKKATNGNVYFGYPSVGTAKSIQDTNVGVGGQIAQLEPATRVEVTAHEYTLVSNTEAKTLFDNSVSQLAVDRQTIVFDGPYHTLAGNGLTIVESGPNYAVVTGIGTLTGKPYLHTTSVYGVNTGVSGQPNVIQIENNYLVNSGNVMNVAQRVANYYSVAKEVSYTMRLNGELPGDKIAFTDPFDEPKEGYIKSMNVTLSKKLNAQATVALGWTPGPFGESFTTGAWYTRSDLTNGRLTFSADMVGKRALIVLFSGAGGGQAGFDGEDGEARKGEDAAETDDVPAQGGAGGAGGAPGERGRTYSYYVDSLPAYYDNVVIGVGGAGGAENGELGQPGTDTSIGTYSTANGTQLQANYTGPLGEEAFGLVMPSGETGKSGGIGAGRGHSQIEPVQEDQLGLSTDGGSFKETYREYDERTHRWVTRTRVLYAGGHYADPITSWSGIYTYVNGGAGGGGAAWGGEGGDATVGNKEAGNHGGNGGDAIDQGQASPTNTGFGGHGGGGGGGAQVCGSYWRNSHSYQHAVAGTGGKGGAGGQGGDGIVVVYYNPES